MTNENSTIVPNRATLKRLPYTLLELINNESTESVDYIISDYILQHISTLHDANIQDIADACAVSKSTISRFCRRTGFQTYHEMKEEIDTFHPYRDSFFHVPLVDEEGTYLQKVARQISFLDQNLNYDQIRKLAEEIYNHDRVMMMGSMQAMNPAANLQQDLFASNKICRAPGSFVLKEEAINKAKPKDLVIIFSNSGLFFERMNLKPRSYAKLNELTVWMITGNENAIQLPYVDYMIHVPNNNSYVTHPLQFNLVESVIALAFAEYCRHHDTK